MGEVVNLRLARKRAARAADEDVAAQNRVRHGLSKAEREAGRRAAEDIDRRLDGARLTRPDEDATSGE